MNMDWDNQDLYPNNGTSSQNIIHRSSSSMNLRSKRIRKRVLSSVSLQNRGFMLGAIQNTSTNIQEQEDLNKQEKYDFKIDWDYLKRQIYTKPNGFSLKLEKYELLFLMTQDDLKSNILSDHVVELLDIFTYKIQIQDIDVLTKEINIHTNKYRVQVYELCDYTLKEQIIDTYQNKQFYTQSQIKEIFSQLLDPLLYAQDCQIYNSNIKIENVFYHDEIFKIGKYINFSSNENFYLDVRDLSLVFYYILRCSEKFQLKKHTKRPLEQLLKEQEEFMIQYKDNYYVKIISKMSQWDNQNKLLDVFREVQEGK
ncbi:hypothetical protein pb186bvf_009535 [Paramecium bursaria]